MDRAPGLSVRLKLTLSYGGLLMLAGALLLAAVRVFLLRRVAPGSNIMFSFLLRDFVATAALVLAFLLVLGLLGGWLLAGRMLAPLTRITDATHTAATGSLSHRIRLPGRRDEFRELADSFDAMLARLEAHDAEQQRFAANASHELRTPLSITKTLLDVARDEPARCTGELIERLHTVNARAIELTEALLMLSRADQRSFTLEHVDLSLIAEEATEMLLAFAEKRGVENTGEQLTPQLVSTLTEPFQRGTQRIRTDHAGVGLGLAIVKSITQAHDGTLTITPRTEGGLRVTVQLPATPTHTGRSSACTWSPGPLTPPGMAR